MLVKLTRAQVIDARKTMVKLNPELVHVNSL